MNFNTLITSLFVIIFFICCKENINSSSSRKINETQILSNNETSLPQISFSKKHHSFGKINKKKTDSISVDYVFKNIGEQPLIITKVDVSCSCLSVFYLNKPIKKDSIGYIKIVVNTNMLNGHFNKSVYVNSNAVNNVELLKVEGNIN